MGGQTLSGPPTSDHKRSRKDPGFDSGWRHPEKRKKPTDCASKGDPLSIDRSPEAATGWLVYSSRQDVSNNGKPNSRFLTGPRVVVGRRVAEFTSWVNEEGYGATDESGRRWVTSDLLKVSRRFVPFSSAVFGGEIPPRGLTGAGRPLNFVLMVTTEEWFMVFLHQLGTEL